MLKHDAKERLTMDQLLSHRWLLHGTTVPRIDPSSSCDHSAALEPTVVKEMARYYGLEVPEMEARINEVRRV